MIEPGSTPPAVPSESVSVEGRVSSSPASSDWISTQEFSGEHPIILQAGILVLRNAPTPEASPPPPIDKKTASMESN